MKYSEFEQILSQERLQRYLLACNNDTRKAMTLYRYNLRLSQELFTLISCFEVALRNAIDRQMVANFGQDWLRDAILPAGIFSGAKCVDTSKIISRSYVKLNLHNSYSHSKLVAEMEFGVWKYMFSAPQYKASGKILLRIFPNKPKSSANQQYNNSYVFNKLDGINNLRNRIAHHEPICFLHNSAIVDTTYVMNLYGRIYDLFDWLGIDGKSLLYGLDHIQNICYEINNIQ